MEEVEWLPWAEEGSQKGVLIFDAGFFGVYGHKLYLYYKGHLHNIVNLGIYAGFLVFYIHIHKYLFISWEKNHTCILFYML